MKKCMSVTLYIPCLSAAATGGIDNGECNRLWPDACWPWPNDLGKDTAGNCWSLNKKKFPLPVIKYYSISQEN